MAFGIDYATPGANITQLKQAGVKFVCRYLAPNEAQYRWKRATPWEVQQLRAGGIALVLVFETSAKRARAGAAAGRADAIAARKHAATLGLPQAPVYFAVDYDAPESDQPAINAYLSAAAGIVGKNLTGVYAGYHVAKRCLDAGVIQFAWQTYAWSGGLVEQRAHLYQYSNGHTLAGVSCDYDRSLKRDYGQSPRPPAIPVPVPPKLRAWYDKIGPKRKPAWFFAALREYAKRLKHGE